nr:MAG: hypothetical protein [uncultured archaeon]
MKLRGKVNLDYNYSELNLKERIAIIIIEIVERAKLWNLFNIIRHNQIIKDNKHLFGGFTQ